MEQRDWAAAITRWAAVIDKLGEAAPARSHAGLARALRESGDLVAAGAAARKGLVLHPRHPAVLAEAARAAEAERDWPLAVTYWERITRLETRSDDPHLRLAALLAAAGGHDRALEVLRKASERHGASPKLLELHADIALTCGHWEDAGRALEKALSYPAIDDTQRDAARIGLSIARRRTNIDGAVRAAIEHRAQRGRRRIAVFSACVAGSGPLIPPERLNDRVDYFVFTDGPARDCGGHLVRPATYIHRDPVRTARFVKTHPHLLLGDYDLAIWVDADLALFDDLDVVVDDFIRSGRPVGGVPRHAGTSLSAEFAACIERVEDDPAVIARQRAAYEAAGFECGDLVETGWMMFDLRDERIARFLDIWWLQIETFSRCDQLSVNFALHAAGMEWHPLCGPAQSMRGGSPVVPVPRRYAQHAAGLLEALGATVQDPFAGPSYAEARQRRIAAVTMPIDVVVCVHNAPDDVRLCLESIDRHRRGENLRLILVDDGSDQRTRDDLAGFARDRPWVRLIRNEAAVGYSHAARIGVGESVAEFVIVLNSDTIVTDGWAEKLADALVSTKGAGIVGPLSNAAGKQSIPETRGSGQQSAVNRLPAGIGPDEMNRHCEQWTVDGILPRVSRIHGFCLGIHRRVLDTVDFFDVENFPRGYGEEDDFCLRAGEAGFGLVIATHTFVYHAKSRSFATEERVQLMRQGAATLVRLHGADRVNRTGEASSLNPILERIRREAYRLYRTPWQAPEQHVDGGPAQVRDADAATGHDAEAR